MLRCKEGDLAVILTQGDYIGYTVTIGKFLGPVFALVRSTGEYIFEKSVWEIHGLEADGVNCEDDSYLQPIRPAPSGITTETKKEITA